MMLRSAALTALLFAQGCLINEALYLERSAALRDDDGDGYNDDAGDCDDTNPSVSPGAAELCNNFDDNCDGAIDELAPTNDVLWGADADGDGFAPEGATPYPSCERPGAGWVSVWDDCDDTRATVFPGAPEQCDGLDNDCDAGTDEEPTLDPLTWYQDDDGDGYGAAASATVQCLAPAGDWGLDATDCDDSNAQISPDADEYCNGVDDDCDSAVDDPPVVDTAGWYADVDGDGYGDDTNAACLAADGYVERAGDCDDSDAAVNPDAVEVCNDGQDNNCDGGAGECAWGGTIDLTDQLTISAPSTDGGFGYAGGFGDLDGDGVAEVVITAPTGGLSTSSVEVGFALVFDLPVTGDLTADDAATRLLGDAALCAAGSSVLVQDLDGDGVDDLIVGAPNVAVSGIDEGGALYALMGPRSSGDALLEDAADGRITGVEEEESVGERLYSLGDIDGDGLPDFGTGSERVSVDGLFESGIAQVFTSFPNGDSTSDSVVTATISGHDENDEIGTEAVGADLDGDGLSDLVLGAQGYDWDATDGAALVFFGPVSGTQTGDDADVVLYAEGPVSYAGISVDSLGDVNDDGLEDIIVGAPQAGEGSAYIVWGSTTLDTRTLGDAEVTFRASEVNKHLGYVVRGLGDLDEDGHEDLFISEGYAGDSWAYLYLGPFDSPGTVRAADADVIFTGDDSDGIYTTAFSPGDATGDGVSDLVVGSYKHGTDYWDGIVYIIDGIGL